MALMEERDQRFRGIERKVGVFIAVALALIVLTIVFIGIRRDLFTPKTEVSFIADTADGLTVNMSVKFKGFIIGRVQSVRLLDDGRVAVGLTIQSAYMNFVRQDSVAGLTQEGLFGDNMIEVRGGATGPPIEDGGVITFEREVSLADIAAQVKDQFEAIIIEVRKLADNIASPEGSFNRSLDNIRVLTDETILTNRNLDAMITSVREDLMPELMRTVRNTGNMTGTADKLLTDMEQKINQALDNLVEVSADLRTASSQVPGVVRDTKEITDSLKGVWPISGGITIPREAVLEIDSDR